MDINTLCTNLRSCTKMGRGELYHGDCFDVMADMPSKSVDFILTDPPYGISFQSNHPTIKHEKIVNDDMDSWLAMLPKMFTQFKRILKDGGVCCCFMGGGGPTPVGALFTIEAIKYFKLIQTLVWKKFIGLGWRYRPSYENIIVLSSDPENYAFYDTSKKCANVIEGFNQEIPQNADSRGKRFTDHPTGKPVELLKYLLQIHSKPGDLVLDPFCGGGSTLVACERMDRAWIGVEVESEYFMLSRERVSAEAAKGRLF